MGLIDKLRAKADERERARQRDQVEKAKGEAARQREEQAQNEASLVEMIEFAQTFQGIPARELDPTFHAKKGELLHMVGAGAALVETRRQPGTYQGGYSGVSLRVAKGVRVHTGGSRGQYVAGNEIPTPIDTGTVYITNRRIVFKGEKHAREWSFDKIMSLEHHSDQPWTSIAVSNRQKVSGFLYDEERAATIRFKVNLALAHYNEDVAGLISSLRNELNELRGSSPDSLLP